MVALAVGGEGGGVDRNLEVIMKRLMLFVSLCALFFAGLGTASVVLRHITLKSGQCVVLTKANAKVCAAAPLIRVKTVPGPTVTVLTVVSGGQTTTQRITTATTRTTTTATTTTATTTVTTPAPPPDSANNTVVVGSNGSITLHGHVWAIASGRVTVDGVVDPITGSVTRLALENGQVWQENASAGLWWWKSYPTDTWQPPGGTTVDPIPNDRIALGFTGACLYPTNVEPDCSQSQPLTPFTTTVTETLSWICDAVGVRSRNAPFAGFTITDDAQSSTLVNVIGLPASGSTPLPPGAHALRVTAFGNWVININ